MGRIGARVALRFGAVLIVVTASAACAAGPREVAATAPVAGRSAVRAASAPPEVTTPPSVPASAAVRAAADQHPGGAGHATFDLGRGVRVYAYWNPGRQRVPWVVNVHGGSWYLGSGAERSYLQWAQHEKSRGWAAFTVDYRLVPTVRWPAPEQDVERAVDWIAQHASYFGLGAHRGFIIGHSAGGQLASIAALQDGGFAGAVDISGAVDPYYLYRHATDRPLRRAAAALIGNRVHNLAAWRAVQAKAYLGRHLLPFLVMHSLDDPVVPFSEAVAFQAALVAHGYPARLLPVRGGKHSLGSAHDDAVVDRWMDSVLAGPHGVLGLTAALTTP